MSELSDKDCVPCKGGVPPLEGEVLAELHRKLGEGWEVINGHHLEKAFTFKNFRDAPPRAKSNCYPLVAGRGIRCAKSGVTRWLMCFLVNCSLRSVSFEK